MRDQLAQKRRHFCRTRSIEALEGCLGNVISGDLLEERQSTTLRYSYCPVSSPGLYPPLAGTRSIFLKQCSDISAALGVCLLSNAVEPLWIKDEAIMYMRQGEAPLVGCNSTLFAALRKSQSRANNSSSSRRLHCYSYAGGTKCIYG